MNIKTADFDKMYEESIRNPEKFYGEKAVEILEFSKPFTKVCQGSLSEGDTKWFLGGKLNVSVNCIDRHYRKTPQKVAIIHEQDEPNTAVKITYKELYENVCKLANFLKSRGVQKGDVVAIYLPNIPQATYSMLACARIGAIHSVIFAGFSAEAVGDRIDNGIEF